MILKPEFRPAITEYTEKRIGRKVYKVRKDGYRNPDGSIEWVSSVDVLINEYRWWELWK